MKVNNQEKLSLTSYVTSVKLQIRGTIFSTRIIHELFGIKDLHADIYDFSAFGVFNAWKTENGFKF